MSLMTLDFDVVIIGCGVSGITSSIYLKRAGYNVCAIERTAPGGQLNMINEINNYPGYISIDGPSLAFNMFNQIRNLDVVYKYGTAKEIIDEKEYKIVKTDKENIKCKYVIISTGRRPRELGLSNEKKLLGKGVSYCSICDGTLYKDKEVCVVGGGNSALNACLYLSELCKKVTLIHRNSNFKGEQITIDKVKNKNNIEILLDKKIVELKEEDDKLSSIVLDDNTNINTSALFIYIGNVACPVKCNDMNLEDGYILVDNNMMSNINGVYACGDAIKKNVYQISTAIGDATTAAMSIVNNNCK